MKTNVYIDGFNLYYGSLKNTPYRWLDISKLCSFLLNDRHEVQRIKYFTARVKGKKDPQAPVRQQTYLRALATIPNLSVTLGHFLTNEVRMPLARPIPAGPTMVRVLKTEEKGSDVNLACHLLKDACEKDCEVALVISNDSDLLEAVRMAREMGLIVGVACPHQRHSRELEAMATFFKMIRESAIKQSQFPDELTDAKGTFRKPAGW